MDIQQQVLHSAFDIERHKKVFINYLEIVIDAKGICHYAVPSHRGKLEKLLLEQREIAYDPWDFERKAAELCPRDRYFDFSEWLCEETGCIMVWGAPTSEVLGKPNQAQLDMLEILKREKLF